MVENFLCSKKVVSKLLERLGLNKEVENIYFYWEQVVGEKLSTKIQIVGIKKDTLLVKTNSSAYYQHLKLHQKEWLKKINTCLGKEMIKSLKVVK